jgi:ubiquinone/menaquinone biosynthesis C-methylase UbiE
VRNREFWDRFMPSYDGLTRLGSYRSNIAGAAGLLSARPGQAVLDAGSGTGNLAALLRAGGVRAVGLDFSMSGHRRHRTKDPGAVLVQASLEEELPFADAAFDGVACLSVLFAISRRGSRLALREFRRVLRPGGRLVVTAMKPGRSKLLTLLSYLRSRFRELPARALLAELRRSAGSILRIFYYNVRMYAQRRQGGYRRISAGELLEEVRAAGFADVRLGETYGRMFHVVTAAAPAPRPAAASVGDALPLTTGA